MTISLKNRETGFRRIAERRGYRLIKSRRRDAKAPEYGRYMLIDANTNAVVIGGKPFKYCATFNEVEEFLS